MRGLQWFLPVFSLIATLAGGQSVVAYQIAEAKVAPAALKQAVLGLFGKQAAAGEATDDSAPNPIPEVSIAKLNNVLERVGAGIPSLVKLEQDDGKLTVDIPHSYQEADQLRNSIGQAAKSYGGHSSVSGNNRYQCHLQSPELRGQIQRDQDASLVLEETKGQKRKIEIVDDGDGIRVSITNNEDYFLLFHDRGSAGLIVQESDADFFFNGHFANFNDFCLRKSDYCEDRLFPIFRRFGIITPETAYAPSVRTLVIDLLSAAPDQVQKVVDEFSTKMTSVHFNERVESVRKLEADYPAKRLAMVNLIVDQQQPAEFRHQLLELLARKEKPLHKTVKSIVLPQDLTANLSFLVWALRTEEEKADDSKDSEAVEVLRNRLASLTQKPTSTAIKEWTELARGQQQTVEITFDTVDSKQLFESEGEFSKVKGQLSTLLQLTSDGKSLVVDRANWKLPFDGLTPRQHFDAVKKDIGNRSLPESWLVQPTDFSLDDESYPLILFDRFRAQFPDDPSVRRSNNGYNNTPNKNTLSINHKEISASIDMGAEKVSVQNSPMSFSVAETGGNKRVLQVVDRPNSGVTITLHSSPLGTYFRFHVRSDGKTSLREFRGNQTINLNSDSFAEFQEQHEATLQTTLIPLLKLLDFKIVQKN